MRTVPRLSFRFDESVGRGRDMESLLREVRKADAVLFDHQGADEGAHESVPMRVRESPMRVPMRVLTQIPMLA